VSDEPDKLRNVLAVMSMPRVTWTENAYCALCALGPLGIRMAKVTGAFWDQCLTRGMESALDQGAEYILTLDYDTVFRKQDVQELYRLLTSDSRIGAICALQMRRACNDVLFGIISGDKCCATISRDTLDAPTMFVDTGHFGLTLIRADLLGKLPKPWFHAQPNADGRWEAGKLDADISFWKNWKEAGFTLAQANRVSVGHLQLMVTWPDRNLKPLYQHVGNWDEHGKPEGAI